MEKKGHRKWIIGLLLCFCILLCTGRSLNREPWTVPGEKEVPYETEKEEETEGETEEEGKEEETEDSLPDHIGEQEERPERFPWALSGEQETESDKEEADPEKEPESETTILRERSNPVITPLPSGIQEQNEEEPDSEGTEQGDINEGKYPQIETDLQSEELVQEKVKRFYVEGKDYQGNPLGADYQKVDGNGKILEGTEISGGRVYYEMELTEGENVVTITVTDPEGRETTMESIFYYGKQKETVLCSLEAGTLGLGTYFIRLIPLEEGESVSQVIERALEEQGYHSVFRKEENAENEKWQGALERIEKEGITEGYRIPPDLYQHLKEEQYEKREHRENSLGSDDFCRGSGWGISVNGEYRKGEELKEEALQGQIIRIRFSLYYGKDIGAAQESWEKEW